MHNIIKKQDGSIVEIIEMERPICSTDIDQEISYLQEEVKRINQEIKSLKEKKELCQKLKEEKK